MLRTCIHRKLTKNTARLAFGIAVLFMVFNPSVALLTLSIASTVEVFYQEVGVLVYLAHLRRQGEKSGKKGKIV